MLTKISINQNNNDCCLQLDNLFVHLCQLIEEHLGRIATLENEMLPVAFLILNCKRFVFQMLMQPQLQDGLSKQKQSRSEKKARKALAKLGLYSSWFDDSSWYV